MNDNLNNAVPGFFGKMPKHGDFVSRNLAERFIEPWDEWLQGVVAAAQAHLGSDWLETYLVCPIWHFVLGAGVIGDGAWIGALMPSVDRVGRYYPLTVAQPVRVGRDGGVALVLSRNAEDAWFTPVEQAMLAVLGDNGMNADELAIALSAGVDSAVLEDVAFAIDHVKTSKERGGQVARWHWPAERGADVADVILVAQATALAERFKPFSAWYARQGHVRAGEFLVMRGLPTGDTFGAMLAGEQVQAASAAPPARPVPAAAPLHAGSPTPTSPVVPTAPESAPPAVVSDEPRTDGWDDTVPDAVRPSAADATDGLDDLVDDELERLLSQSSGD